MLKDKTLTYISLFSGAGVGCHGFKKAGFECIVTNELIERRLNVQKFNHKCKYESAYVCDDITIDETKSKVFTEINRWKKLGNDRVDVLIATPPCQGMSVANHKKAKDEIVRNSLVVESILIIKSIKPRFFILENVSAFMKTGCTAPDGKIKSIGDVIVEELAGHYSIAGRVLNLINYGSNSSRTRALIIGVSKELSEYIAPIELFPTYRSEMDLRTVIGNRPRLEWGEICDHDFYHFFRTYHEEMRNWISDLHEGECAFDHVEAKKRPHRVINGEVVENKRKNGDKYTRQCWDKVPPCIHTRNDQLASQNTIHPVEDRVFSIRELMEMMTIPDDFRWVGYSLEELNRLPLPEKFKLLKKEEIKIRQSIGEAVPTGIFFQLASNIQRFMQQEHFSSAMINQTIKRYGLDNKENLSGFIADNPLNLGDATLARIVELANNQRENHATYFTNKSIVNEIYKELPSIDKSEIRIIEPSVGVGNFLPFIFKKYEALDRVVIDLVDIDQANLDLLKLLLMRQQIPKNVSLNFINADFLLHKFEYHYDLVVGNPPFSKLKFTDAKKYLANNYNKNTTNTFEFFLEKALIISDHVAMITPKAMLNTPEFELTRELLGKKRINCILDFGENGFKGVLVETICVFINVNAMPTNTKVTSVTRNQMLKQKQSYITDKHFPYWLIYRDHFFDLISERMEFNLFTVFRDRQITNSNTTLEGGDGHLRVLKSRNISDDGKEIISIPGYDAYIDLEKVKKLSAYKFFGNEHVYLTPNMTYKPRVIRNVKEMVANGSVAVLIPKEEIELSKGQLEYFSSDEYRDFYKIARNYQTRSLNVDSSSVYFYGVLEDA